MDNFTEKLLRLPKWAQNKIKAQETEIELLRAQLERMDKDADHDADELMEKRGCLFYTSDMADGKVHHRYFDAWDVDIKLDNGLQLNVYPTRDGDMRIIFGVDADADGTRAEAMIRPTSGNAFNIEKVYKAKE